MFGFAAAIYKAGGSRYNKRTERPAGRGRRRAPLHMRRKPWARPELAACGYYREEPAQVRGIAVHVALFPAGSARMRRAAADRLLRYFSEAEGLPAPRSSVVISTPQQEREEEVWK